MNKSKLKLTQIFKSFKTNTTMQPQPKLQPSESREKSRQSSSMLMFRVLQLMMRLLLNSWKLLKFLPPMAKLALLEAAVKTTDSRIGGDRPNISKTSSFTISMETVPKMNR